MKTILEYHSPANIDVVTETGFRYLNTNPIFQYTKEIEGSNDIDIFEQFYKLNNSIRYCNDHSYKFQDIEWTNKYKEWLSSEDYKKKSFQLYYGNGIVD